MKFGSLEFYILEFNTDFQLFEIKKTSKVDKKEIDKAENIRKSYLKKK